MATYRGGEVPLLDRGDEDLRLAGKPLPGMENVEEELGLPAETGSPYEPRPGDKGYTAKDKIAQAFRDNLTDADNDLKLTPQERNLYIQHLANLQGKGGYWHGADSVSTLYATIQNHDGKEYVLPRVQNGAIVDDDEAGAIARMQGLDYFPSYATPQEAKERYEKMHTYMDRDAEDFINTMKAGLEADRKQEGGGPAETGQNDKPHLPEGVEGVDTLVEQSSEGILTRHPAREIDELGRAGLRRQVNNNSFLNR